MADPSAVSTQKLMLNEVVEVHATTRAGNVAFRTRVVGATTAGIEVAEISGKELPRGQAVTVLFFRPGTALRFESRVLERTSSQVGPALKLAVPNRVQRYERRRSPRREMKGTVRFAPAGREFAAAEGQLRNISETGCSFTTLVKQGLTAQHPLTGVRGELAISLAGFQLAGLEAEIRRVRKEPRLANVVAVHLRFTSVPPAAAEKLRRLPR